MQAQQHTKQDCSHSFSHIGPLGELQKTELPARVASYANIFISLAGCLGLLVGCSLFVISTDEVSQVNDKLQSLRSMTIDRLKALSAEETTEVPHTTNKLRDDRKLHLSRAELQAEIQRVKPVPLSNDLTAFVV